MKELILKFIKKYPFYVGLYAAWLFTNIVFLTVGGGYNDKENFLPFVNDRNLNLDSWDISESLVYGIGPLILYLLYLAYEMQQEKK